MNIAEIVDGRRLQPLQMLLIGLVLFALVIDGVDIQLLSLVAPVIIEEWGIGKAAFGPAMGAALIGMSIGAGAGGWIGDRRGRKSTLTVSVLLFGAATIGASMTHGVMPLALLRFLTGLGFGAAAPNGMALLSEWLPRRVQSRTIALASAAIPIGGLLGAAGIYWLLPIYAWRGCFVICGGATLIVGVAVALFVPESADLLLAKGQRARAAALLRRVLNSDAVPGEAGSAIAAEPPASPADSDMFAPAYRRLNIGVWILFVGINFVAYGIAAWTPVYLTAAGFTLPQAIGVVFVHSLTAVAFATLTSFVIRRFGTRLPLPACCAASFTCICLLAATLAMAPGVVPSDTTRLLVTVTCAGIGGFNGAAIALTYALLAFAYPTASRARGIGIGIMMGRLGGVGATLLGGALLSLDRDSTLPFFAVCGALTLSSAIGAAIVDRHIPPALA